MCGEVCLCACVNFFLRGFFGGVGIAELVEHRLGAGQGVVDRIVQWRWRANRSSFGYLCCETEPSNYYVQAHVCVCVNLHRPVGLASLSEQTEAVGGRCHSSVCWEIAPNIEFRCLFSLHHSHPLTLPRSSSLLSQQQCHRNNYPLSVFNKNSTLNTHFCWQPGTLLHRNVHSDVQQTKNHTMMRMDMGRIRGTIATKSGCV